MMASVNPYQDIPENNCEDPMHGKARTVTASSPGLEHGRWSRSIFQRPFAEVGSALIIQMRPSG